ncbi:hypothetical protein F5884DRAFT_379748 [Xylogone sp. PMI_703]|nr:hypothetical protein F5884DRAFT_379748 [Xylogone sp. PMI_703]
MKTPTTSSTITLLTLPGEIRNAIYAFTWLLSRDKPHTHHVPDLEIHPGGITSRNIDSFPLLFTCKQIYDEVIPAISAVAWMEIRAYEEPWEDLISKWRREAALVKGRELCRHAREVTVSVSSTRTSEWARPRVLGGLALFLGSACEKLRHLEIKVCMSGFLPERCDSLEPLLGVAKRGVEVLVECFYTPDLMYAPKKVFERRIGKVATRAAGRKAQIWIEWTTTPEELVGSLSLWSRETPYHLRI